MSSHFVASHLPLPLAIKPNLHSCGRKGCAAVLLHLKDSSVYCNHPMTFSILCSTLLFALISLSVSLCLCLLYRSLHRLCILCYRLMKQIVVGNPQIQAFFQDRWMPFFGVWVMANAAEHFKFPSPGAPSGLFVGLPSRPQMVLAGVIVKERKPVQNGRQLSQFIPFMQTQLFCSLPVWPSMSSLPVLFVNRLC